MSIRDVMADVSRWREEGQPVALATVVRTWGSGPRGPGAKMAVSGDGRIAGSVSGGRVESAVVEEASEVLETGESKLLKFGVADETAWEVGLSCGGTLEIFVEELDEALYDAMREAFVTRGEFERELTLSDGTRVFHDVEAPPPVLVMVGGVHIARALCSLANTLGYRTIVIDPRGVFGNEERFSHAKELLTEWPDDALVEIGVTQSTAVVTLTHDPKLDDPALGVALKSPAFYVGALGSRKTNEKRRARLLQRGVTESELSRLHAPIGLEIGSRTPEEIALSVMAEIVAARNGVPRETATAS
ncbi:MAG TPA: XdhC family protein [Vicinamibacteria bacterium]|nr:XdhC family protein [Vicinamibacteria bacterium]